MIKFDLTQEELDKLNVLIKTCQSISDISIKNEHYIVYIDNENKLNVSIYGCGNAIKFTVDVSNVEFETEEEKYFNINIFDMIKAFEKVYKSSGSNVATASVENSTKFYVTSGKSKIVINIMDTLPLVDLQENNNGFDTKNQAYFEEESINGFNFATITKDVINFMDVANKSITLIGVDNVSGIELADTRIKFSDDMVSVADIETETVLTKPDCESFISNTHFDLIQGLYKIVNDFKLIYDETNQFVKIDLPSINFKAILALPQIICSYPDNDSLLNLKPNNDDCFEFSLSRDLLLEKMDMFDGMFPASQWRFKTINFTITNEGELNLYYSNFNAEVDTDIEISDFKSNSSINEYMFKVPTIILRDYLTKLLEEDIPIKVKVSGYDPDASVPNSLGISFKIGNIDVTIMKLLQEESY